MADWQVDFYVVPKRALAGSPSLAAGQLEATDWWTSAALPPDYRERFGGMAVPAPSASSEREAWGREDGNRIDVRSQGGRPASVRVRLDVRRPDAKFAAGLLTFVRVADAAIVRSDGRVIEPNAGGFGLALRSSAAWQFVKEPLSPSVTGYRELPADDE